MARFTDYVIGTAVVSFGAFVAAVNVMPDKMPVVPGLSQVAPVLIEYTQFGETETKFISHYDVQLVKRIQSNARRAQVEHYQAEQLRNKRQEQYGTFTNCTRMVTVVFEVYSYSPLKSSIYTGVEFSFSLFLPFGTSLRVVSLLSHHPLYYKHTQENHP